MFDALEASIGKMVSRFHTFLAATKFEMDQGQGVNRHTVQMIKGSEDQVPASARIYEQGLSDAMKDITRIGLDKTGMIHDKLKVALSRANLEITNLAAKEFGALDKKQ